MGKRWACAVAVVTAGLLVASAAAQSPSGSPRESFTAEERRRLEEGRLVARRSTRRRGQLRLVGGNAWRLVDRPADVVWRALCDEEAYPRIFPSLSRARTVWHRPGERVMRFTHSVGLVTARYHLRLTYDHDRRDLAFRLDRQRPNDIRAAWGFIQVSPYHDASDRSLISYGVMADIGGGVIGGVFRDSIHDALLRVPSRIRRHVQGG